MRNYLSSRAVDRVSVGGDDTGNNIAGVLNASDGDTVDCLKYNKFLLNKCVFNWWLILIF